MAFQYGNAAQLHDDQVNKNGSDEGQVTEEFLPSLIHRPRRFDPPPLSLPVPCLISHLATNA